MWNHFLKYFCRRFRLPAATLALLCSLPASQAADIELPVLGDTTSGIISKQQEYDLGRTWLKMFRSRVRVHDDPLMQQYLEQLLYNLATHSDLQDPRLELIIVNNPTMNAFAVPGGVVGFHTGIFSYAENEDQMASVLAHEIAHLSQRHFARGVEQQRKSAIVNMAGMLAALVLAATAGGDAGMAAMVTTQAAALDSQLRYSRSNEQEADRAGLQTMEHSGRDPGAVADMFESMLRATRYTGSRPPEFLLTHPITEKRVADARNRAMNNSMRHYPDSKLFYLMRARSLVALERNPQASIQRFQSELNGTTLSTEGARYGLALAYMKANNPDEAEPLLQQLIANDKQQLAYQHSHIELLLARKEFPAALHKLDQLIAVNSNSYPLLALKGEVLWQSHNYEASAQVFERITELRPEDPAIWYSLAEVNGLAGDIPAVHQARAEYFILIGVFDKAREQLGLAQKLVVADFKRSAIIQQRLRDVADMEEKIEKL